MKLEFNLEMATSYLSNSQKARVLTEFWVLNEIYCPSCGNSITNYSNNMPVADFFCKKCSEDFELKSTSKKIVSKVPAGSYAQMLRRISSATKPNFFFMQYLSEMLKVNDFIVVPKYFFIPELIEERKPLASYAKRAGWIGSNILFSKIPKAGQIYYIENGVEINKKLVMDKWKKTVFLKQVKKNSARGWILDIMNCIDALNQNEFALKDIYDFEKDLLKIHPENMNIKAKIRQQLQLLRDNGYLDFMGEGRYKLR